MKDVYTFADLQNWGAEDAGIRLAVFGDPVAHSLSPKMQNAALEVSGIGARYAVFDIKPTELEEALRLLPARKFIGVNLTLPHKVAAAAAVDELDAFAREVGAVNTVRVEGE